MSADTSNSLWSPALRIMLRPAATYRELSTHPSIPSRWMALRRAFLYAFVLGCTVSFAAYGRLTLRLVVPATIYAGLEVLIEVLAVAVVLTTTISKPDRPSFSRSLDLFFAGFGPWLLWLLAFATIWACASPVHAFRWTGPRWDLPVICALAVWSVYIDFCFFRYIFRAARWRAARDLVLHRAISWTLALIIFGGGSLWPEFVRSFGI